VLDVGCGPCDKAALLQSLGYSCSGYDDLGDEWHRKPGNREAILAFARDSGIDFHLASGASMPFAPQYFDMVMSHDMLEHLHDSPRELLNDLVELIRPGGLLFLTVPSAVNIAKRLRVLRGQTNHPPYPGYYWFPGSWRGHVREYCRRDLELLSGYLGLELLELGTCDHMLRNVPARWRSAYLLATRIFPDWKDSWRLVAMRPEGWTPRRNIPPQELARLLGNNAAYMVEQ